MKRNLFILTVIAGISLLYSCNNITAETSSVVEKILQHDDGTISLKLDNADFYADAEDRVDNTAEWNVVVSKSGRYNVWITSATLDTTDLKYKNPVMVNIQDKMIQARPGCDKIVMNSSDVPAPYFRADSFIGSLYLQDTGQFYVQVTSEMIMPKEYNAAGTSAEDITRLISVSFTPVVTR
ncbi:MAG: hypothetical protein V1903_07635 [Bacteroidota bacterium]